MMDASAIKLIQDTAIAAAAVPATDQPVIVVPNDMRLESLEQFEARRSRFRGTFKTSRPSAFLLYVHQMKEPGTRIFVSDELCAKAVINFGDADNPGHADHIAILSLSATAPYKALRELTGCNPHEQRALAEWIEDWRHYITPHDKDGKELEIKRALAAVRNVEILAKAHSEHSDEDFASRRSSLEQIEAKSRHGLPVGFTFTCEPYHGLQSRTIDVRLSLLTSGNAPRFSARIVGLEAMYDEMHQELSKMLAENLDPEMILSGEFKA